MILEKLLRKSKHCVSKDSSGLTTVQTVSINLERKRHFSKVYCSPDDNNAILTDFRGALGVWEKTVKQARSLTEKKLKLEKKKLVNLTVLLTFTAFSFLDSAFAGSDAAGCR